MNKMILSIVAFFLLFTSVNAGTAASSMYRQTGVSYEECIKKIPLNKDQLYKHSQIDVINRKDNRATLRHTGRLGQSFFVADESEKISPQESSFEIKMVQYINGTLTYQSTLINVKNVNGKALITITMTANVESFWASAQSIKAELDQYILNTIWQIEANK